MKTFMDDNFLLDGETAGRLYHDYAKGMPILDYHCHVPPQQIAENQGFENITQVWLRGDHYKWRAMRTNGVPEKLITGDTPDRDKFNAWAATVPRTLGNPLYHWTHLELRRVFSIEETLSPASADRIWNRT
ncbi:MAG: glucuronate isomerase, partial [Spirochaetales bacterium]|nr:glucuronate isomerase [Spirochaetales bacterium]